MQKKQIVEIIAGLMIITATAGAIAGTFLYEDMLNNERKTIVILALALEFGNWSPPEIKLVEGEPVRLKIRNTDTVTHGFAVPELGIGIDEPVEIKAGHVAKIDITPTKKGTFLYVCTVWCSKQHPKMVGRIIISEK
ncbi:MAG TPA: cupredoxin domain-containing protein [Candidatus Methanoperedens sp.]|nr:cupredoxin domain-containing protein [Candidatus Methanoperedens sp.]HLB71496.1 cupredoxin domain-containing protein [Candidatus Methanoperedens sp.]